jgi:hypothetical protein
MNIELSKNNHLTWGYNNIAGSVRTNPYDKFFINYGKASLIKDFRSCCIDTAKEIYNAALTVSKTPLIFYSGGVDSETMLISFIESKVDFSVAHIRFQPKLNEHETFYVEKFSKKYNLDLKLFDVDVESFLRSSNTFDIAVRDNARMIELEIMKSITDEIKHCYYPVLDHPGTYLYREHTVLEEPSRWMWKDYESLMFYYNYCRNENMPACPSFFHWSPEIILSYLLDKQIVDLVNNRSFGKITNRTTTMSVYKNTFPEYEIETRSKFTGYENISKRLLKDLNYKLICKTRYSKQSGQEFEYSSLVKSLI